VVFETNHQEQLIFKHAISTVVMGRRPGAMRSDEDEPTNGETAE
jgi:sRNA-binding regulator protein Hfq